MLKKYYTQYNFIILFRFLISFFFCNFVRFEKVLFGRMENTTKVICRDLADLLVAHGVDIVFSSPGSRNAPLIVAFSNKPELKIIPVVDERISAFMALGYALVSGKPVALLCTSGTALLNYLPAIAEAYYRKIPLIVISADRPIEWIDQDDSQTIKQFEVMNNFVKGSYDISDKETPSEIWYYNRVVNDALILATKGRKAPVHINIRLTEPLGNLIDIKEKESPRVISVVQSRGDIPVSLARNLASRLASPAKVMIIAGFLSPDNKLNKALNKISHLPNIIILTESISNLYGSNFISTIDSVLSIMTEKQKRESLPDIVITLGGAIVSRHIKTYLRTNPLKEHWHVGLTHTTIDCFCALTERIDMEPSIFFQQLASGLQPYKNDISSYRQIWLNFREKSVLTHDSYIKTIPWSDLKAFSILTSIIPRDCNIQISNGTPIRYMQLFADSHFHRSDCNRGVSGIDGSTSTAVGASMAALYTTTVLISGDMSASYDIGALEYAKLTPNLRIIIMMNGGGSIFRFIPSTGYLPQMPEYMAIGKELPIEKLASAFGLSFFEADSKEALLHVFPDFMSPHRNKAAILAIYTPTDLNIRVLKDYFNRNQK